MYPLFPSLEDSFISIVRPYDGELKKGGFHLYLFPFIFLSITLQTSKFRNQFTISSKYFDMACYKKWATYSGPISFEVQKNDIWTTFNHLRCLSSSTTLGTRTGYWKPTRRGTDEIPLWVIQLFFCQNDPPMGESIWLKDSLITHILFELWLIMIFSPVANFAQQPLYSIINL